MNDLSTFLNQEVYARLSAEDVYTDPHHQFQKSGDKWRGDCRWHQSESKSAFNVTPSNLRWFCPGCGFGGGPVEYIHRLRGGNGKPRSSDFVDIVRALATMTGLELPSRQFTPEEQEKARQREMRRAVLEALFRYGQGAFWTEEGEKARAFLVGRGFQESDFTELGLGLYTTVKEVRAALEAAGCDLNVARSAGVLNPDFEGYILIPWLDAQGRPLTGYLRWQAKKHPRELAKTLAFPGEGTKGSPLYFDRARKAGHKDLVLVEGVLDGAMLHVRGQTNTIACVGAQLTKLQAQTLARYQVESVTIALDPDHAGEAGILSCLRTLEGVGIAAHVAPQLPEGLDPDDFYVRHGEAAWREHIVQAIHGYRHRARVLVQKYQPATGWNDQAREKVLRAAKQAANGLQDPVAAATYFWPEIAAATGTDGAVLSAKAKPAPSSNGTHAPELEDVPPPFDDDAAPGGAADLTQLVAWEPPIPFAEPILPPFPVDAFPGWAREYVRAVAVTTQTPPDLPALLVLGALACACAKKFRLCVRADWSEPLNLYLVLSLPPGERKSPVMNIVSAPIIAYNAELKKLIAPEIEVAENRLKILQGRLKHAIDTAAKGKTHEKRQEAEDEVDDLTERVAEARAAVPVYPRLLADDATPEALANLLSRQKGRIAIFSPEGGVFELMKGRYSQNGAANLEIYLKAWSGDPVYIDRVGKAPEHILAPALTLALAVQPAVIREVGMHDSMRGKGLLGRFLYSIPKSLVGSRLGTPQSLPPDVKFAYGNNLTALLSIPAEEDQHGEIEPENLHLDADAWAILEPYKDHLEKRLGEHGDLHHIADWGAKLAGSIARIACLLYIARHATDLDAMDAYVTREWMVSAIEIGNYFIDHARSAFADMGADPAVTDAKYLLKWLIKNGKQPVAKRDFHQKVRGKMDLIEKMEPGLKVLTDHGYLLERKEQREGRGARKVILYPNPHLFNLPESEDADVEVF